MAAQESTIREYLSSLVLPGISAPLSAVGTIGEFSLQGDQLSLSLSLGFHANSRLAAYQQFISESLQALAQLSSVVVSITSLVAPHNGVQNVQNLDRVKNIIAVASGKGGVGKSTTSVNLAIALAQEGARVGLLDADIYGPSMQMMLGVDADTRPKQYGTQYMLPIEARGIQSMSMAYLVTEKTPMVWRGPMATGALQQLLYQTYWQDLDYLVIDMPPGTGDIQLTLSQKVPVAGAVIVTTPQDIALLDAKKGIEMFRKVSVPVLGVVENMAVHICSECGHHEHIFGSGGGDSIASEYGVAMLGSLPLSLQIREQADKGEPLLISDPDGEAANLYRGVAIATAAELASRQTASTGAPNIVISND